MQTPSAHKGHPRVATPLNTTADILDNYVLVVDDDLDLAQMLVTFVETSQRQARQALDFEAFEALCAQRMPDALLLDLIMPDDCPGRICRWLASIQPALPVALISALSLEELHRHSDQLRALGLQSVTTLRKPYWPRDIAKLLQDMGVPAGTTR